jgi:hypothetical protein
VVEDHRYEDHIHGIFRQRERFGGGTREGNLRMAEFLFRFVQHLRGRIDTDNVCIQPSRQTF